MTWEQIPDGNCVTYSKFPGTSTFMFSFESFFKDVSRALISFDLLDLCQLLSLSIL